MVKTKILYAKDVKKIKPNFEGLILLSRNLAETTETVVMEKEWKHIKLITTNNNPNLFHQVEDKLTAQGYILDTYFTDNVWIQLAIEWYTKYEAHLAWEKETYDHRHTAASEEAIELIKQTYATKDGFSEGDFMKEILRLSFQSWASDVHFQAEEVWVVMRLRIDGMLQTVIVFSHKEFQKYLMKLKFDAWVKMNTWMVSQDGRFDFPVNVWWKDVKVDVRVSVMPWLRGESLVLRFLDSSMGIMDFHNLWCEPFHSATLDKEIVKNYGLILVTWPTWSWKTTTVYSLLNAVNTPEKKIITLEDPVEYELPWIEQSQIDKKKWYTFEAWLKWVLRHDPDVIMVWEIRTLESAEMAVNAALTWHLVISTIHTNSAVEAVTRLLNMWVKPFMLASSLNCIVWQRLLRKIAKPRLVDADKQTDHTILESLERIRKFQVWLQINYDGKIFQPDKRVSKFNWWYDWRTAVFEIFQIDEIIKEAILSNKSVAELKQLAKEQWFLSLRDAAILKMLRGVTSIEEIYRIVG